MNNKQRVEYIDALKGLAIFFVLWGHSLQYLKNEADFFHNPIFEFIYSFHMPLFFMISGFFFNSSLKLNFKEFIYKKTIQLLLPCIAWAAIFFLMKFSQAILTKNLDFIENISTELKPIYDPRLWPWFLKELFISCVIVYTFIKFTNTHWLACLLSISFVLFAPHLGFQRFLLPLFWTGFFLKKNYTTVIKYSQHILLISALIFAICLFFWDGNYTIYITTFPQLFNFRERTFDFTNLNISLFRLLIGVCGSLFWFMFFKTIYKSNRLFYLLGKIGAKTLAIYLLQILVLEIWINKLVDFTNMNIWIYSIVVTPIIAILTITICMMIINIIQKNKYADLLLFGNQISKKNKSPQSEIKPTHLTQ